MTWHNLPCPPTLAALSAACPRGWIEFEVEHHAGSSGFGGGDPQEPETVIHDGRLWGVEKTDTGDIENIIRELWMDGDLHVLARGIPDRATVIARVEQAPLRCNQCGGACDEKTMYCAKYREDGDEPGCIGLAIIELALVTTWGGGGKPVYWTGEGAPDYSGQQAAPTDAPGDMWAQIIARAEQHGVRPSLIERMHQRRQQGIENYGRPLAPHNGRDVIRDVMEESLDRLAFLEQLAEERPDLQQVVGESQSDDLVLLTFLDQLIAAERGR